MPDAHVLVVADEYDEDGGGLDIEHPPGCPTVQAFSGVDQIDCPIANEVYNSGLEMHFRHRDDPEKWPYAEYLAPGRYEIELWLERHPAGPWGPEEWSGGLRTVTSDG